MLYAWFEALYYSFPSTALQDIVAASFPYTKAATALQDIVAASFPLVNGRYDF